MDKLILILLFSYPFSVETILITGGTGYIGSHTAVELIQREYHVSLLANLPNSKIEIVDTDFQRNQSEESLIIQILIVTNLFIKTGVWVLEMGDISFGVKARLQRSGMKLLHIMDRKLQQLKQYPSKRPQQQPSPDYPYPLRWTELLGESFHPLCYKYHNHLLRTCPMFEKVSYR